MPKFVVVLSIAFVLPICLLGITAYRALREEGEHAGREAAAHALSREQQRLLVLTRETAGRIDKVLQGHRLKVAGLRDVWQTVLAGSHGTEPAAGANAYLGRYTAGLPGYGFVHPEWGAYGDFERRTDGCPWAPRPVVEKARRDPAFRVRIAGQIHRMMRLNPLLIETARTGGGTLDLAWIVLADGVTNVNPPYDLPATIARDRSVLDLDESDKEYVRLAGPEANPERRTIWLEPYHDPFKWVWMSSVIAPLYTDNRFQGTVGIDILVSVIAETVLRADPGGAGYAFLLSQSGALITAPEQGIDDLAWDERQ